MAKEEGKVMGKDTIVLAQTDYKGNSHFDTEEIEIIADGNYYKKGQKDVVHPTLAAILRAKGLVATLLVFFLMVVSVQAQTLIASDFAGQIGTTRTLANATADTINLQITKARPQIMFKYDITKNSGTVAGTIVVAGRVKTTDAWATINSYTLTDATATNSVILTANNYVYYRVITTPSGTQNSTHSKYLVTRQY